MRADQINNCFRMLEEEGWTCTQYRTEDNANWWLARYHTPHRRIEVYVGSSQDCLLWQLPLTLRPLPACRQALCRYLLQLNHELKLAKFSLDGDDQIHLMVETMASSCTFSVFKGVLTALCIYFEQYHREIELLATNPALAEAWLSLTPPSEELEIEILP